MPVLLEVPLSVMPCVSVSLPFTTWLSSRASQSWDTVTCASSLDQWEGRGEGSQSELLSSDWWCSLLSPAKWQELLGHLRTALLGVLLPLVRKLCSLERWKIWLQNSCCCFCPHHRKGNQLALWEREVSSLTCKHPGCHWCLVLKV